MDWKKNIFSYILWLVYSAATGIGVLGFSTFICSVAEYPVEYGFAMAGGFLLLIGVAVLVGRKLVLKHENAAGISSKKTLHMVLESLCLVILLAAGLWLRIDQLMSISDAASGAAYLEAAYVTAGSSVPQVVHGATYLYLCLLHMLFFLLGNSVAVALVLQMTVQLLGALVWYFAVRRLAGVLSGLVSFAFLMLSAYMVAICAQVSPAMLLFLIYGIVLYCVAGCLKAPCNPVWVVLAGVLTGVILYLDIFGITLLLFFGSVLTLKRQEVKGLWRSKGAVLLCAVCGAAAGFFGAIGLDALASGKTFVNVLWAWCRVYQPGGFSATVAESGIRYDSIGAALDVSLLLLLGGMAAGCFSFWCRRRYNRQGVWIAFASALTALLGFRMEAANVGSEAYLYIVFSVLAGLGVEAVFMKDAVEEVVSDEEKAAVAEVAEASGEVQAVAAEGAEASGEVQIVAEEAPSAPAIQFLENPLPLPKKHTPKTLDYRIQGEAGDQFDLDVAEDDDFDI